MLQLRAELCPSEHEFFIRQSALKPTYSYFVNKTGKEWPLTNRACSIGDDHSGQRSILRNCPQENNIGHKFSQHLASSRLVKSQSIVVYVKSSGLLRNDTLIFVLLAFSLNAITECSYALVYEFHIGFMDIRSSELCSYTCQF